MKIVVLLFILSLVGLQGLFGQGLPITHDGPDHVARIANFYESLAEGNIFPRWAGNLNWGYGHPILMFLYPLPSYSASLFHFIGFSFVDSTKLVFAVFYVLSLLSMYMWLSTVHGKRAGFVGSILYGFAPYRFVDMYVRGAIGEHAAFAFLPFILWGISLLAKKEKITSAILLASLGTTGLLLSHNALSVMFFPIVALYALYLLIFEVKEKKKFIGFSIVAIFIGFLLSAFFALPAFLEGKYTLRDILTKGEYATRFVNWPSFIYSSWNYYGGERFSKEIGFTQWILVLLGIVMFFRSRVNKIRWLIAGTLILFFASLFIMTSQSEIVWRYVTLLQKFQFPWRFLSVSVFIIAFLGAIITTQIPRKFSNLFIFMVLLGTLSSSYVMWHANGYVQKPDLLYVGAYSGTTDTGESSPIWSVRFMERGPSAPIEVIEGEAKLESLERTNERHIYKVTVITPQARILENTLYFPGWTVLVDGNEIPITDIEFQNPTYRGLMTFVVPNGSHELILEFRETKLRKISDGLSIFGIAILLAIALMPYLKRRMISKL